jgi:hypothetical protein
MGDNDSIPVNTGNEFCLPSVSLHGHFYVTMPIIITAEYSYKDYSKSTSSEKIIIINLDISFNSTSESFLGHWPYNATAVPFRSSNSSHWGYTCKAKAASSFLIY